MPSITRIDLPGDTPGRFPYSQAVASEGLLFVAGQLAGDEPGWPGPSGDIAAETRMALQRIGRILAEADTSGGAKRGWEMQVGMSLACTDGEDEGMQARYTVTSVGGKRAVQTLAVALAEQVEKDQTKPVPVVRLKKDHYSHKSYGKIFTPVFEVVEWVSMDGEAPAVEPEEPAAPTRRRRSV